MKYNIYNKKAGVNPVFVSCFETAIKIVDMVLVGSEKMFVLTSNDIMLFDTNTQEKSVVLSGAFENANNFDYDPVLREFWVVEKDIQKINKVSEDGWSCENFMVGNNKEFVKKLSAKHNNITASIAALHGWGFYLCIKEINQIFKYTNSNFKKIAGTGHARYSVGSTPESSSFNFPSDIFYRNNKLYIADTDNHCIRALESDGVSMVFGSPNEKYLPKKVVANKKSVYFTSENNVFSWGNLVFKSKNNAQLFIGTNQDYDLFIVEENN